MPAINFRLAPELHERFVKECERRGVTVSDFLREAIEKLIDRVDDAAHSPAPPRQEYPQRKSLVVENFKFKNERDRRLKGFDPQSGEPLYSDGPSSGSRLKTEKGKK